MGLGNMVLKGQDAIQSIKRKGSEALDTTKKVVKEQAASIKDQYTDPRPDKFQDRPRTDRPQDKPQPAQPKTESPLPEQPKQPKN